MKLDIEIDLTKFKLTFAFGRGGAESKVVVTDEENHDYLSDTEVVRTKRVYDSGDSSHKWFAFWEESGFCPCVYVIRAESFEDALYEFENEFATELAEADFNSMTEEERQEAYEHMSSTGKLLANHEIINGQEITLLSIETITK